MTARSARALRGYSRPWPFVNEYTPQIVYNIHCIGAYSQQRRLPQLNTRMPTPNSAGWTKKKPQQNFLQLASNRIKICQWNYMFYRN